MTETPNLGLSQWELTDLIQMDDFNSDNLKIDTRVGNIANPNLLDNWYFGNPVDQRGGYVVLPGSPYDGPSQVQAGTTTDYVPVAVMYTGHGEIIIDGTTYYVDGEYIVRGYTGAGYGIDRWTTDIDAGGAVLVTSEGITLTAEEMYWGTRLENPGLFAGMNLTASALTADGVLHSGTVLFTNTVEVPQIFFDDGLVMYINTLGDNMAQVEFKSASANTKITAAKLELSTTQTLAHQENGQWVLNDIPNFQQELAKCQRYQVVMGGIPSKNIYIGVGQATNTTDILIFTPLPVPMRSVASASFDGTLLSATKNFSTFYTTDSPNPSVSQLDMGANQCSALIFTHGYSNLTSGETYLVFAQEGSKLILDANL